VRRRRAEWWGAAVLTALVLAGCAGGKKPGTLPAGEAISVDVADLWKKESAEDPIKAYTVRLAADPDNAGLHNNLGNAYALKNMMDKAIREFKTAAKLDPASPIPWNNMGTTYRKMERHSQAHSAFRKALDVDPRYALAWYNLGTLYDDAGDYDAAIEHYLKAVALKPELAEVKFNPQVVENRNLMVVKLRHFLEESGNIALPLDRLPE
jgi:tetratricopeptide (TPR) repeat protein